MTSTRYAAALLTLAVFSAAGCETTKPNPTATAPGITAGGTTKAPAGGGTGTRPATTPLMAAGGGAVTPEMIEALRQLSAEDYQTRQEAMKKLQQAMTTHFQQMVLVQQLMLKIQDNLAEQLRQMTLSAEGEGQSRVASLMEFNQALSRWAIDVLGLPEEKRDAMLKWGLSPDGYPLVVRVYSSKDEVRAGVTKELAKIDSDNAIWLLGRLLDDVDREVALSTMDAIWDKAPTPQMIDILWNKAVGQTIQQYRPRPTRSRTMNVHGRLVQVYDQDYNSSARMQDADVAADVLIHWRNPVITDRLNTLFKEMAASIRDPNDYRWRVISPNYGGEGAKTLSRLMEAYKPKEGFQFIMKVLASTNQDGYINQMNNVNYWQSSRVDAAALLCRMTGQDPEDYKIQKYANYGDRWMLRVNAKPNEQQNAMKEEQQMIRQLLVWWNEHYKEYGVQEAPKIPKEEKAEGAAAGAAEAPGAAQQKALPAAPPRVRARAMTAPAEVEIKAEDAAKAAAAKQAKEAAARAAASQAATAPAK